MIEYFLGIDIGTTSVKSIAFSASGKTICSFTVSYAIHHPFPDWSEQNPDEIWSAVKQTVENILHALSPDVPRFCSFSSAMHSLIAVNEKGDAISPSIIWADNRAALIASVIHSEKNAMFYYQRTGLPVHAMSPFCKLQWMRENQSGLFQKAFKYIGIKEFIFFKLFGIYVVDASVAASTGLMNAVTKKWDPQILDKVGISDQKLSNIVEIDAIFTSQNIFPVLKEVPFVVGGSDGAMANLGTTDAEGSLVVTVGTSSAARIITRSRQLDEHMRTFCYYLSRDQWLVGGASNNGGIVLQWLQEDFFQSDKTVSDFLHQAAQVKPGADGLIFLPYLLGERAPIWNAEARGILFGLTIRHNQAAMIRASLEGINYCILAMSRPLMEKTKIKNIYATGGFARNELGLQMMSDMFNLPVIVCETVENSAWGAVKCGMRAMGIHVSAESPASKTYYPDADIHPVYRNGFQKFQHLYELNKDAFQ